MKIKALAALLLLTGVAASAKTLKVVTTTSDLASLVAAVGGNHVNVSSLIVGARDPHRIEAKPSYMSRVSSADLFVAVGLELEIGYEGPILMGSRNPRVAVGSPGHVYASDWVQVLEKPSGRVDRSMGDIHPFGNPHIWLDPYNGRLVAQHLADKLSELDPADASDFKSNFRKFANRLDTAMFGSALVSKYGADKLWTLIRNHELLSTLKSQGTSGLVGGWVGKMAPYVGSKVITYHKSWPYLLNRFGLISVGELEPKPGIDPTPSHVSKMIDIAKSNNVKVIMQEPFYSTRNADFVASRSGAKTLVLPGNVGHESGTGDYIALFDVIISRLSSAMGR